MGRGSDDATADLELFASFVRDEERREREAKAAARAERRAANELRALEQAKDDAAATLKRLRGRSGVSADERKAAEEAYRVALAAVVAAESGQAPDWAPTDETATDEAATDEAATEEPPVREADTDEADTDEASDAP